MRTVMMLAAAMLTAARLLARVRQRGEARLPELSVVEGRVHAA